MHGSRRAVVDGYSLIKNFQKGQVYDSRADGEFYIPERVAIHFINHGYAHEQTTSEWIDELDRRRKAMLDDPNTSEVTKANIRLQDAIANPIMDILNLLPNPAMKGFSVGEAMRKEVFEPSEQFKHLFKDGEVI